MLKFLKTLKGQSEAKEITFEDALEYVLSVYRDNDMTRDMLTVVNHIDCGYSWIDVHEVTGNGEMCLMPGLVNSLPMDHEYDDEGNRVK